MFQLMTLNIKQKNCLGKTLTVYALKNKKHAWVKTSTSREELSYVSVQILNYDPISACPVATATEPLKPDQWTFAHIEASRIAYLFLPSAGSTFLDLGEGCYSVPQVLHRFLLSLNLPSFIEAFESQLKAQKSVPEEDDNE